jgi:imidazole glycerol phosphate synthase subunit HisF
MTRSKTKLRIYTVVDVWRGIAVGATDFMRLRNAQKHVQRLRRYRKPMEDDVKLFETTIYASSPKLRTARSGI